MAFNANSRIVTTGLVAYMDLYNTLQGFRGAPTTNLFPAASFNSSTLAVTWVDNGDGQFFRVTSGTYAGYTVDANVSLSSENIVYRMNFTSSLGSNCWFHGPGGPYYSGNAVLTYTFSFDYYISPDAVNYPFTNFIGSVECYAYDSSLTLLGGLGAGNFSAGDPTPSVKGVWKTISMTNTVPTLTNSGHYVRISPLLYPGACGAPNRLADTGFILYRNPQLELRSVRSPFINGARTTSQAIIDLTKNVTVSATSLTYNSNGTVSFNGTSNGITMTKPSYTNQISVEVWLNCNGSNLLGSSSTAWIIGIEACWRMLINSSGANGITDNVEWVLATDNNGWYTTGTVANTANSIGYVPFSGWKQVVGVYTGSRVQLYMNGVLITSGSTTISGNVVSAATALGIGTSTLSIAAIQNFQGNMAQIKIYDRALDAQEILQNFSAHRGRHGI